MSIWNDVLKGIDDGAEIANKALEGHLRSNKAINSIGKFVLGGTDDGIRGFAKNMSKEGTSFSDAAKSAYTKISKDGKSKSLNYKAIAGTYVGASLAGRVLTGGGIYKDKNGNNNVPIIPFM